MRSMPLVSIIVPVFNGEQYLRKSLDSILNQTYANIEVIVMDDASTDLTSEVVGSYGNRVSYYRQPGNRGIYGNMNDGIDKARGEFIAIYHADDIYHPAIVEREVQFLERYPEAGAVFCQDIFIDAEGNETGRLRIPPEAAGSRPLDYRVVINCLLTYKNHLFVCPTCMVRTSVYRDVGVYRDVEFRNTSDLEMYLRIARKYPVGILEDYLLRYRHGHGSSAQRYHHLRTDPERYFRIMDLYLREGGYELATPEALKAYEAHRSQDQLMRAVNNYILGKRDESLALLGEVRLGRLLGSSRIQGWRMLALFGLLALIARLPRISTVADLFYRRWHDKSRKGRSGSRRVTSTAMSSQTDPRSWI
jgi:glycosyltransferase involved in cell wall biosynthesis